MALLAVGRLPGAAGRAQAVFFICEEERRAARESFWLYRCHEAVVSLDIAAPRGDAAAQKQAVLQRFPELAGKRALVFLGRIHEKERVRPLDQGICGIRED
jgi:hypothetical protein